MKRLKIVITKEFQRLINLAFDEISAITAPKIVTETYERLLKENKKEYKKICDDAIEYALVFLEELQDQYGGTDFFFDKVEKEINAEDIVNEYLKAYNPVTGYVYDREVKRKEARTSEGMIAGKKGKDRPFYRKILETSTNLWFTQTKQYAEDIADGTVIRVWKTAGVKKVMWVTARDERVCEQCGPLDGKVFKITEVPPKPHYRCRFIKVPLPDDNNTAR